jgi:hypothetical protein
VIASDFALLQGMGGGSEMQMGRDLALLAPEIAALLIAVGALVLEMLRLPRVAFSFTGIGLLVATGLTFPLPPSSPSCPRSARTSASPRWFATCPSRPPAGP